jgi:protein disulfide-isomerase A6
LIVGLCGAQCVVLVVVQTAPQATSAVDAPTDSAIVELTAQDFDKRIDGSKHALVQFYASWCGHCKTLAPEYEAVAVAVRDSRVKDAVIARIDADLYRSVGSRYNIAGYPTVVYFPKKDKSKWQVYTGERTAEKMVKFMNSMTGKTAVYHRPREVAVVLDDDNFSSMVHDVSKHVLVQFYAPWCAHCKHLAPDYELVAKAFQKEPSVIVAKYDADWNKQYGQQYGVTAYPTIKLFNADHRAGLLYEGARDPESILAFLNKKVGTVRGIDGQLKPESAVLATMGEHVQKFLQEAQSPTTYQAKMAAAIQEARSAAESLHGVFAQNAEVYIAIMLKINDAGVSYLTSEQARLARLLKSKMTDEKANQITRRRFIVADFLARLKRMKKEGKDPA